MAQRFDFRHGQWFDTDTAHSSCAFCLDSLEVAFNHMADAELKTTKYTKRDGFDEPHQANVARLPRGAVPIITKGGDKTTMPVTITVPGVAIQHGSTVRTSTNFFAEPKKADIDMSDAGLAKYSATATPNEEKLIYALLDFRIRRDRLRDVVLDLTEAEAALVLDLLHKEEDFRTSDADANYQNGSGYEKVCASNRHAAKVAETVADRLGKTLGKHLDKAYAGELGA